MLAQGAFILSEILVACLDTADPLRDFDARPARRAVTNDKQCLMRAPLPQVGEQDVHGLGREPAEPRIGGQGCIEAINRRASAIRIPWAFICVRKDVRHLSSAAASVAFFDETK